MHETWILRLTFMLSLEEWPRRAELTIVLMIEWHRSSWKFSRDSCWALILVISLSVYEKACTLPTTFRSHTSMEGSTYLFWGRGIDGWVGWCQSILGKVNNIWCTLRTIWLVRTHVRLSLELHAQLILLLVLHGSGLCSCRQYVGLAQLKSVRSNFPFIYVSETDKNRLN